MTYAFINHSVGKYGKNVHEDVMSIQIRINRWIMEKKLPEIGMLAVDGSCGPATKLAIGAFQKRYLGVNNPDCRVDPGGKTLEALFASLVSPQVSEAAYREWLKAQAAAGTPAEAPAPDWHLSAKEVGDLRKNWGEDILAWARLPPSGSGTEAKEFHPQKLNDRYATVFGWKSIHAKTACVPNPNQRVQLLAMLREDMPYWLQRTAGNQQQAVILQYTAACAIRDYRRYVINEKKCPKAVYNLLAAYGQDLIYQMFLAMFQLLSPVGLSGAPAASGAVADTTKTLIEGMKTGKWPWTPTVSTAN